MKRILSSFALALGLSLVGCGKSTSKVVPYRFEVEVVNVGTQTMTGLKVSFGTRSVSPGGLGRAESNGFGFFETEVPYPTRIEYYPYGATSESQVIYIKDLKAEYQIERGAAGKTVIVEIDPDHQSAVSRIK